MIAFGEKVPSASHEDVITQPILVSRPSALSLCWFHLETKNYNAIHCIIMLLHAIH